MQSIRVDAGRILGKASQISDFLGAGGIAHPAPPDNDDPINIAWRKLKFKHVPAEHLYCESEYQGNPVEWARIERITSDAADIDFTYYDLFMDYFTNSLQAQPYPGLIAVPRKLSSNPSSPNYYCHMPRDLDEWRLYIEAVVRHTVDALGMKGLYYMAGGEPEYAGQQDNEYIAFFSHGQPQDKLTRLHNHISMYATIYRAVKSIDPSAVVCAPGSALWSGGVSSPTDDKFTMEDWIKALKEYNDSLPADQRVGLDCADWQDYNWLSDRISDGADAVSAHLARYGFDPDTPKSIMGGGAGAWSSDWTRGDLPPSHRASYLMHNIVREFKDPTRRKFTHAVFFFFADWEKLGDWFQELNESCGVQNTVSSHLVYFKLDGSPVYNPSFASYQIASKMADQQDIVSTAADGSLEAMATRNGDSSVMAVVNNHSSSSRDFELALTGLPFPTGNCAAKLQRIDETHSNDGKGLEEGESISPSVQDGTAVIKLSLEPYSTIMATLTP